MTFPYTHYMKPVVTSLLRGVVIIFAIIGFVLSAGYFAVTTNLTDTEGIDEQSKSFMNREKEEPPLPFPLADAPEWSLFKEAVTKDKAVIEKISQETGIPGRILVAILVPEQMRLFYSNRALFKKIFEPLKILGDQSQFSWGIFGIKDETARAVEKHLRDPLSPFYLGTAFEHSLLFTTSDHDQERFSRIIDSKDHTYAYRYAALYIAQIESQWEKAGYSIADRPDIIATLWNLGFEKSKPNQNPKSGGSVLEIDEKQYSFGTFAYDFYYSNELLEMFPRK